MRVLFSFIGGSGHVEPLVPIARAIDAAGHTVALSCGAAMASTVERLGFPVFQLGTASASAPERLPLRPIDMQREAREFRDGFARDGARGRAPHMIALCRAWQPDLIVCDETDFGDMIAAESLGLPYASVLVLAAGFVAPADTIRSALDEVRADFGLLPDPQLTMLSRYLVLAPFPASYRDPAFPLPATALNFRQSMPETPPDAPAWAMVLPGAPVVYFTLGTVFNTESGDLFARVLAGLRDLPINLLVTVGRHIDPAEFGAQPANVRIEQFVPQASVLPYCDLVVSHGGSGSVLGALAHGLPSVLIPMGADQPVNAARCVELGVARMLDPIALTPESVRAAVTAVLENPVYRQAAAWMRDEFAALPDAAQIVPAIERIVADAHGSRRASA